MTDRASQTMGDSGQPALTPPPANESSQGVPLPSSNDPTETPSFEALFSSEAPGQPAAAGIRESLLSVAFDFEDDEPVQDSELSRPGVSSGGSPEAPPAHRSASVDMATATNIDPDEELKRFTDLLEAAQLEKGVKIEFLKAANGGGNLRILGSLVQDAVDNRYDAGTVRDFLAGFTAAGTRPSASADSQAIWNDSPQFAQPGRGGSGTSGGVMSSLAAAVADRIRAGGRQQSDVAEQEPTSSPGAFAKVAMPFKAIKNAYAHAKSRKEQIALNTDFEGFITAKVQTIKDQITAIEGHPAHRLIGNIMTNPATTQVQKDEELSMLDLSDLRPKVRAIDKDLKKIRSVGKEYLSLARTKDDVDEASNALATAIREIKDATTPALEFASSKLGKSLEKICDEISKHIEDFTRKILDRIKLFTKKSPAEASAPSTS